MQLKLAQNTVLELEYLNYSMQIPTRNEIGGSQTNVNSLCDLFETAHALYNLFWKKNPKNNYDLFFTYACNVKNSAEKNCTCR